MCLWSCDLDVRLGAAAIWWKPNINDSWWQRGSVHGDLQGLYRFFYGPALLSLVEPVTTILVAWVSVKDSPFCQSGNICGNISISLTFGRKGRNDFLISFQYWQNIPFFYFFEAFCLNTGLSHHTVYLNAVKRKCLHLDEGTSFN